MTQISTQLLSDGTLVLKPSGPVTVNAETDTGLLGAFNEAILRGQLRIVLDLSETTYMDSSGFAAVVRGWISVQRAGGEVVFARPPQSVKTLLKVTRLLALVKTSDSLEESVAQFHRGDLNFKSGDLQLS